ncbi:MAG: glycosyltransferase family 4 protein [Spirochaetales bacterium]|nr:glycosyltransferase family 4 protein [Spirochaetales bacterium]
MSPESHPSPVILASGLPLRRMSSFSRQLGLLAGALGRRGVPAGLCDSDGLPGALARGKARALILLGYPDQFPFLTDPGPGVPAYLWAQSSRPPAPGAFGPALPVPLTRRTAELLGAGGCARVGPVIPHGVDTGSYRPPDRRERARARERHGLTESFAVGTVGAHTRRKRFDLILEALAALLAREPAARLLVKTDRLVSLEGTDLRLQARRLGVESQVRFVVGAISPAAMAELYWGMDVYLNLSEWEGFCLPVAEAMACGVPVVTHAVQGPGEIVPYRDLLVPGSRTEAHGETALLRADPAEAAAVLLRAAESPQLLGRLGEAGRRAAERSYDIHQVAEMWQGLLEGAPEGA